MLRTSKRKYNTKPSSLQTVVEDSTHLALRSNPQIIDNVKKLTVADFKKIEFFNRIVSDFFSKRLKILNYQRPYVWNDHDKDAPLVSWFWDSITGAIFSQREYGFGIEISKATIHDDYDSAIIDGQQKITTTYILLFVILRHLLELKHVYEVSGYQETSPQMQYIDSTIKIYRKMLYSWEEGEKYVKLTYANPSNDFVFFELSKIVDQYATPIEMLWDSLRFKDRYIALGKQYTANVSVEEKSKLDAQKALLGKYANHHFYNTVIDNAEILYNKVRALRNEKEGNGKTPYYVGEEKFLQLANFLPSSIYFCGFSSELQTKDMEILQFEKRNLAIQRLSNLDLAKAAFLLGVENPALSSQIAENLDRFIGFLKDIQNISVNVTHDIVADYILIVYGSTGTDLQDKVKDFIRKHSIEDRVDLTAKMYAVAQIISDTDKGFLGRELYQIVSTIKSFTGSRSLIHHYFSIVMHHFPALQDRITIMQKAEYMCFLTSVEILQTEKNKTKNTAFSTVARSMIEQGSIQTNYLVAHTANLFSLFDQITDLYVDVPSKEKYETMRDDKVYSPQNATNAVYVDYMFIYMEKAFVEQINPGKSLDVYGVFGKYRLEQISKPSKKTFDFYNLGNFILNDLTGEDLEEYMHLKRNNKLAEMIEHLSRKSSLYSNKLLTLQGKASLMQYAPSSFAVNEYEPIESHHGYNVYAQFDAKATTMMAAKQHKYCELSTSAVARRGKSILKIFKQIYQEQIHS